MRKILLGLSLFGLASLLPARAVVLVYKPLPPSGLRLQAAKDITLQMNTTGLKTPPVKRSLLQTEIYQETVSDIDPDGTMSLIRQAETGQILLKTEANPAKSFSLPGTQSFFRLTNRGKILSLRTFLDPAGETPEALPPELDLSFMTLDLAALEVMLTHPPLPQGEVQINQSWSEIFRLPNFLGASVTPVTLTSRLLEITQYQGRDCAKIRTALEVPLHYQYSQFLADMQIPQTSRDNLKTQGCIIGRREWLFDLKRGCLIYAEGPLEISAQSNFYFFDEQNHTVNSRLNFTLKSYNKTQLLETTPPAPEIP